MIDCIKWSLFKFFAEPKLDRLSFHLKKILMHFFVVELFCFNNFPIFHVLLSSFHIWLKHCGDLLFKFIQQFRYLISKLYVLISQIIFSLIQNCFCSLKSLNDFFMNIFQILFQIMKSLFCHLLWQRFVKMLKRPFALSFRANRLIVKIFRLIHWTRAR